MAGNYPDPIGNRLAYDKDGTLGFILNNGSGAITQLTAAKLAELNDEALTGYQDFPDSPYDWYFGLIFPTPRDLAGFFFVTEFTGIGAMQVSADTTNGQDGTWTQVLASTPAANNVVAPNYRTPNALTSAGVKAVRIRMTGGYNAGWPRIKVMHLYGKHSAATDRLAFWHPSLNEGLVGHPTYFDWGNRPRGTTASRSFRLKNLSGSLSAQGITVGIEALTDATPTKVSQHQFSLDGITYTPTLVLPGPLGPGETTSQISVRQSLLAGAALGLWTQRLYASVGEWT